MAILPAEGLRPSIPAVVCSELLLQRSVPGCGASLAAVESTTPVSIQRERASGSPGTVTSLASAAA
jgi:hypothetical protein